MDDGWHNGYQSEITMHDNRLTMSKFCIRIDLKNNYIYKLRSKSTWFSEARREELSMYHVLCM